MPNVLTSKSSVGGFQMSGNSRVSTSSRRASWPLWWPIQRTRRCTQLSRVTNKALSCWPCCNICLAKVSASWLPYRCSQALGADGSSWWAWTLKMWTHRAAALVQMAFQMKAPDVAMGPCGPCSHPCRTAALSVQIWMSHVVC
eukprot:2211191-Amphidinium_carterae.1